jgi:hypothetical protein
MEENKIKPDQDKDITISDDHFSEDQEDNFNSENSAQELEDNQNLENTIYNLKGQQQVGGENNSIHIGDNIINPKDAPILHPWSIDAIENSELSLEESELTTIQNELMRNRIVLLYSEASSFLTSTIKSVLEIIETKPKFRDNEKKLVYWEKKFKSNKKNKEKVGENEQGENGFAFESGHSIDSIIYQKFDKEKPTFVKVLISEFQFLSSIYITDKEKLLSVKDQLKNQNIFLICVIDKATYQFVKNSANTSGRVTVDNIRKKGLILFKELSFIHAYIKKYFPESQEEITGKVFKQLGSGLWGTQKTNESLAEQIIDTFLEDQNSFIQAIEERDNPEYKNKKLKLLKDLPFNKEPYRTTMFVASFFPDISTTDFRKIMTYLLDNKEDTIEEEQEYLNKKQQKRIIRTKVKKQLSQIWEKNGDQILQESSIVRRKLKDGRVSFDFISFDGDGDVSDYFQTYFSLYLIKQFEKLLKGDFFFKIKSSDLLINNLIQLIIKAANYDPDTYGLILLQEFYVTIVRGGHEILLSGQYNLSNEELQQAKIISAIEKEILPERFIELMHQMLEEDELIRNQVFDFFRSLLLVGRYDDVIIFIGEFSKTNQIDSIHWVREVLEHADDINNVNEALTKLLLEEIKRWEADVFNRLQKLYEWVPDNSYKGRYSDMQLFAAFIILRIGNPVTSRFPLRLYGEYPYKFPLFYPISKEKDSKEYFLFLVRWLFNKPVKILNARVIEDQAFTLESWMLILKGIETKVSETALVFCKTLVSAVREILDKDTIRQLQNEFTVLFSEYEEQFLKHQYKNNYTEKILFKLYRAKMAAVRDLRNYLKPESLWHLD